MRGMEQNHIRCKMTSSHRLDASAQAEQPQRQLMQAALRVGQAVQHSRSGCCPTTVSHTGTLVGPHCVADQLVLAQELARSRCAARPSRTAGRAGAGRTPGSGAAPTAASAAGQPAGTACAAHRLEVVQARDRQRAAHAAEPADRRPRRSSGSSASSPPDGRRAECPASAMRCGSPPCTRGVAPDQASACVSCSAMVSIVTAGHNA